MIMPNQKGNTQVLILVSIVGIIFVLLLTNTFNFKSAIFHALYPKPSSEAKGLANFFKKNLTAQTPQPTPTPVSSPQVIIGGDHYANHSFIFPNLDSSTKTFILDEDKKSGKKFIRTDYNLTSIENTEGVFNWKALDEITKMATDRGLTIVGTLGYSAPWIAAPGAAKPYQGPIDPNKLDKFVAYVKATVAHYPQITYWEVWNEPDATGLYDSDPAGFAKMLALSYQTIKQANPNATVLFPGVIYAPGNFTKAVLTDPNYPGSQNYDIANFHDRAPLSPLKTKTIASINMFNTYGKKGAPIWVTEHGYPSNYKFQKDPNYTGTDAASGEQAQANYYKVSLPLIISLGVSKVFVSSRDANNYGCNISLDASPFCSEGIVTFPFTQGSGREKPSFSIFQAL